MSISTDAQYTFDKPVRQSLALNARLHTLFGARSLGVSTPDADRVTTHFTEPLSAEEQATLAAAIAEWVDPPFWLELERTENTLMRSIQTSETHCSTFLETFIMSPYLEHERDVVMGSMKTIVRCDTADLSWVPAWDPTTSPITIDVCLYCGTTERTLSSASVDMSAALDEAWRPLALAGSNVGPAVYKSAQLYGLDSCNPSSDRIWHLQGGVSDSNVTINLNGLQRLYYYIVLPS